MFTFAGVRVVAEPRFRAIIPIPARDNVYNLSGSSEVLCFSCHFVSRKGDFLQKNEKISNFSTLIFLRLPDSKN